MGAVGLHERHPLLHALVLILKDFLVAISEVHGPGDDRGGISPACGATRGSTEYVRNNKWNPAVRLLIGTKIFQPFGKEVIDIKIVSRCSCKSLRITGPP